MRRQPRHSMRILPISMTDQLLDVFLIVSERKLLFGTGFLCHGSPPARTPAGLMPLDGVPHEFYGGFRGRFSDSVYLLVGFDAHPDDVARKFAVTFGDSFLVCRLRPYRMMAVLGMSTLPRTQHHYTFVAPTTTGIMRFSCLQAIT